MGINKGDVLRSKGGLFNATMNPKPKVTAEVPRGSIIIGSMSRFVFELTLRDNAKEAGIPSTNVITTVTIAYPNDVPMALVGVT